MHAFQKASQESMRGFRYYYIWLLSTLVLVCGLTTSYISQLHFEGVENAWLEHSERATSIGTALAALDREIGYGGFIHDFKNLVLRRELTQYQEKLDHHIVAYTETLSKLRGLLVTDEELRAVDQIRATFDQYVSNYQIAQTMIANNASAEMIDAIVKVDDTNALAALSYLHGQSEIRAFNTKNIAEKIYAEAVAFLWLSRIVLVLSIIVATVLIVRSQSKLIHATEQAERAKNQLDTILDTSPDPMLTIDTNGCITRINRVAEEMFGYEVGKMVGMKIEQLMPESYRERHVDLRKYFTENPNYRPMMEGKPQAVQRHDGSELKVEISLSHHQVNDETHVTATLRDITQKELVKQQLIDAREEAERANRAKSEFLSSMSHELRTPMNAILGFSQILLMKEGLSNAHRDSVNEIYRAGRHLLGLINEVLDLAKIESGKLDLSIESIALKPLLDECFALTRPLADERGVILRCVDLGEVAVNGDRSRLKQVLINLLSNGIKYNRDHGSVSIDIQPKGDKTLRILVSDTGSGIAEDKLMLLFKPFQRLVEATSGIEGTGIGLTLSKQLVELMGGAIGVESKEGEGSTFWVDLPVESVPENIHGLVGETSKVEVVAIETPESDHHRKKVIYVEDNPSNLELVTQILGMRENVKLITAHTANLGIELAMSHQPDLILLDICMPEMDGFQVIDIIKRNEKLKDVPVIAVSANAMPKDIKRGFDAGFNEYITKPIDVDRFLSVIDSFLVADDT